MSESHFLVFPWSHYVILPWYGYVWNVHRMSIKIEHRNLGTRKTLDDFFVQLRNFWLPLSLKVIRHKEREAQSFYSGFLIWPHHRQHVWHPPQRCPWASENQPSSPEAGLISTNWLFQNLPKSSARFRCVTSFALANLRFPSRAIVTSLSYTSALRTRTWTPVLMLHLTNPCAEPKVSEPN